MADLFGEQTRNLKGTGYAGRPGAGPAGETCGTCKHFRRSSRRHYHKCGLIRSTGGPGTDILVKAPACEKWCAPSDTAALSEGK